MPVRNSYIGVVRVLDIGVVPVVPVVRVLYVPLVSCDRLEFPVVMLPRDSVIKNELAPDMPGVLPERLDNEAGVLEYMVVGW